MSLNRQLGAYHPDFGWHFVPGLKARIEHEGGGYLVRVNQMGFRSDQEFEREKAPGTFRVLLFGDSFVAGTGVSNRARFSDLLPSMLPGNVEVFNFGMLGTGTDEHYLIWRSLAREIEADLVIISVWLGSTPRIMRRYRGINGHDGELFWMEKPYYTFDANGELELHNVPVPKEPVEIDPSEAPDAGRGARKRILRLLPPAARRLAARATGYEPQPILRRGENPTWRLLRAILDRWTAELSTPVIIMPLPLQRHVEGETPGRPYQQRFATLADPPKVSVHDPLPELMRAFREGSEPLHFEHDFHPTAAYHRIVAESLAGAIQPTMRELEVVGR